MFLSALSTLMLLIIVQTLISVQGGNFNNLEWILQAKGTLIVVKSTESSLKTENLSKNVEKVNFYTLVPRFLRLIGTGWSS